MKNKPKVTYYDTDSAAVNRTRDKQEIFREI
jgi:hypothetical protein